MRSDPSRTSELASRFKTFLTFFDETISDQDAAIPLLQDVNHLLSRLLKDDISQVLSPEDISFLIQKLMPSVTSSLLKTIKFRKSHLRTQANQFLEKSVYIFLKYYQSLGRNFSQLVRIFPDILNPSEKYYELNNQVPECSCNIPICYEQCDNIFIETIVQGSQVDVIQQNNGGSLSWSTGILLKKKDSVIQVQYLNTKKRIVLDKKCCGIAVLNTYSKEISLKNSQMAGKNSEKKPSQGMSEKDRTSERLFHEVEGRKGYPKQNMRSQFMVYMVNAITRMNKFQELLDYVYEEYNYTMMMIVVKVLVRLQYYMHYGYREKIRKMLVRLMQKYLNLDFMEIYEITEIQEIMDEMQINFPVRIGEKELYNYFVKNSSSFYRVYEGIDYYSQKYGKNSSQQNKNGGVPFVSPNMKEIQKFIVEKLVIEHTNLLQNKNALEIVKQYLKNTDNDIMPVFLQLLQRLNRSCNIKCKVSLSNVVPKDVLFSRGQELLQVLIRYPIGIFQTILLLQINYNECRKKKEHKNQVIYYSWRLINDHLHQFMSRQNQSQYPLQVTLRSNPNISIEELLTINKNSSNYLPILHHNVNILEEKSQDNLLLAKSALLLVERLSKSQVKLVNRRSIQTFLGRFNTFYVFTNMDKQSVYKYHIQLLSSYGEPKKQFQQGFKFFKELLKGDMQTSQQMLMKIYQGFLKELIDNAKDKDSHHDINRLNILMKLIIFFIDQSQKSITSKNIVQNFGSLKKEVVSFIIDFQRQDYPLKVWSNTRFLQLNQIIKEKLQIHNDINISNISKKMGEFYNRKYLSQVFFFSQSQNFLSVSQSKSQQIIKQKEVIEWDSLPRNILGKTQEVYEIFISFLNKDETFDQSFSILNMIPAYKKYEQEILQLSNREDLKNYLMSIEMGELLYKLKLIEIYLSRNKYEVWIKMFVESEGYSVLEDILWEVKSRQNSHFVLLTLSEILRKYYVKKYNFESEWQDIIINLSFQSMFIFEEFEKLLKKLNKHAIKREEVKENCKENEIVFDRMLQIIKEPKITGVTYYYLLSIMKVNSYFLTLDYIIEKITNYLKIKLQNSDKSKHVYILLYTIMEEVDTKSKQNIIHKLMDNLHQYPQKQNNISIFTLLFQNYYLHHKRFYEQMTFKILKQNGEDPKVYEKIFQMLIKNQIYSTDDGQALKILVGNYYNGKAQFSNHEMIMMSLGNKFSNYFQKLKIQDNENALNGWVDVLEFLFRRGDQVQEGKKGEDDFQNFTIVKAIYAVHPLKLFLSHLEQNLHNYPEMQIIKISKKIKELQKSSFKNKVSQLFTCIADILERQKAFEILNLFNSLYKITFQIKDKCLQCKEQWHHKQYAYLLQQSFEQLMIPGTLQSLRKQSCRNCCRSESEKKMIVRLKTILEYPQNILYPFTPSNPKVLKQIVFDKKIKYEMKNDWIEEYIKIYKKCEQVQEDEDEDELKKLLNFQIPKIQISPEINSLNRIKEQGFKTILASILQKLPRKKVLELVKKLSKYPKFYQIHALSIDWVLDKLQDEELMQIAITNNSELLKMFLDRKTSAHLFIYFVTFIGAVECKFMRKQYSQQISMKIQKKLVDKILQLPFENEFLKDNEEVFAEYLTLLSRLMNKEDSIVLKYIRSKDIFTRLIKMMKEEKSKGKEDGGRYKNMVRLYCRFIIEKMKMQLSPQELSFTVEAQNLEELFECERKRGTSGYLAVNQKDIFSSIIKQLCSSSFQTSKQVGYLIINGDYKCEERMKMMYYFMQIQDQYQQLRIEWMVGKKQLKITQNLQLQTLLTYSLEEHIYYYKSALSDRKGKCILQTLFNQPQEQFKWIQLCQKNPNILSYLETLGPPTYKHRNIFELIGMESDKVEEWQPIDFNCKLLPRQFEQFKDLEVTPFKCHIVYGKTLPTSSTNKLFLKSELQKLTLKERLKVEVLQNTKKYVEKGYLIRNKANETFKIETDFGRCRVEAGQQKWIWNDNIKEVKTV